jgi:hypothetical protein
MNAGGGGKMLLHFPHSPHPGGLATQGAVAEVRTPTQNIPALNVVGSCFTPDYLVVIQKPYAIR